MTHPGTAAGPGTDKACKQGERDRPFALFLCPQNYGFGLERQSVRPKAQTPAANAIPNAPA